MIILFFIILLIFKYDIYIYSQLSVSRITDKLGFSISRTHLVGLVGFVSSSMLNLLDKSDKFDWISRTHIIVIFMIFILDKSEFL